MGLIDAFLILKEEYPEFKLVIISRGFKLNGVSMDNSVKQDIIIVDEVSEEELILYYNCAFTLVLPSFYEGFGLPIIEAMACGCPVITSNISSMPEIGGDAACYIDPNNVPDIADAIKKFIKNNSFRGEMIEKGRKRARYFSWKNTARSYLNIFKDCN